MRGSEHSRYYDPNPLPITQSVSSIVHDDEEHGILLAVFRPLGMLFLPAVYATESLLSLCVSHPGLADAAHARSVPDRLLWALEWHRRIRVQHEDPFEAQGEFRFVKSEFLEHLPQLRHILVRDEYTKLWDYIDTSRSSLVVLGQPGIGRSSRGCAFSPSVTLVRAF